MQTSLSFGRSRSFVRNSQGEDDGFFLEVIAETEVTEHLEERVVTRGRAHVFEVVVLAADADALLRRGGAPIGSPVAAREHVLETGPSPRWRRARTGRSAERADRWRRPRDPVARSTRETPVLLGRRFGSSRSETSKRRFTNVQRPRRFSRASRLCERRRAGLQSAADRSRDKSSTTPMPAIGPASQSIRAGPRCNTSPVMDAHTRSPPPSARRPSRVA